MVIVLAFVVVATYAVIAIPPAEAARLWTRPGVAWQENPRTAGPVWLDLFTRDKLPRTVVVSSTNGGVRHEQPLGDEMKLIQITLPFRYDYDGFPSELNLFTNSSAPIPISVSWRTPDGRELTIAEARYIRAAPDTYYISQDSKLYKLLGDRLPHYGLFADPQDMGKPLKGNYEIKLIAEIPRDGDLSAKLVVYGRIHGLAGTDHLRRDISVALLWGAVIAMIFGLLAAVGTTVLTYFLAATGTWLGGKVDRTFQWITQVNLIIPLLPVLIMFGHLYDRSIWTMLGLVIALNIFAAGMVTYRAMFLQAKEAPYIEAAQAYGARNWRIIFRYLMPRLAPTLLPEFVLVVPSFVFLEATLSLLGLGDPNLPTWGKVLEDAYRQGALYHGHYYWILEPAILLVLVGVGFSLIGYSLDRIFNPKLRTV